MTEQLTGRIEEALKKYNLEVNDDEVKEAVKKIIAEKVPENDNLEVKKFLMGSVVWFFFQDWLNNRYIICLFI